MTKIKPVISAKVKHSQNTKKTKCADCTNVISPTENKVKCSTCNASYHADCVNVSTREWSKINSGKQWFCSECNADSDDDDDEVEDEESTNDDIRKMLATILKKMDTLTKQQNEQTKQTKEVIKSQQFMSSKHDEIFAELKKYKEENKSLRSEISSLTKKFTSLSKEVEQMKSNMNRADQTKLCGNVLIRGIKHTEDAMEAVKKIASLIDLEDAVESITSAKMIRSADKDPVIVVVFKNEETKHKFVRESKMKRISSKMYGYDGDEKPIYVDEQLTKDTFLLFKHTKKLKKCGYRFVWLSRGNIMVRETSDSAFIKISTSKQVDELEKNQLLKKPKSTAGHNATPQQTVPQNHKKIGKNNTTKPLQKNSTSVSDTLSDSEFVDAGN